MRVWRRRASLRAGSRSRALSMSSRVLMGGASGVPRGVFYNGWALGSRSGQAAVGNYDVGGAPAGSRVRS